MAKSKLTDKQALFCQEYLVDLNATQAAIRAGYSKKTAGVIGIQNLGKLNIQEVITKLKDKRSEKVEIDAAWVLRQAVKLHQRCMQEVKPKRNKKGEQITDDDGNPVFEFNASAAAKGLELVGKHVNILAFKEQIEHSGTIKLDDISDEELDEEIKNLAKN
jgi:phage terminase small subunit